MSLVLVHSFQPLDILLSDKPIKRRDVEAISADLMDCAFPLVRSISLIHHHKNTAGVDMVINTDSTNMDLRAPYRNPIQISVSDSNPLVSCQVVGHEIKKWWDDKMATFWDCTANSRTEIPVFFDVIRTSNRPTEEQPALHSNL
ncbi:hypothetical protein ScPMuIL_014734 [Solemya velum]